MTAEQQACEGHFLSYTIQQNGRFVVRLPVKMEPNPLGTSPLCRAKITTSRTQGSIAQFHEEKRTRHRDLVNSQEGKKACYCLPHPGFKEKGSTTRTQIASDGGAKSSNGTQQHTK